MARSKSKLAWFGVSCVLAGLSHAFVQPYASQSTHSVTLSLNMVDRENGPDLKRHARNRDEKAPPHAPVDNQNENRRLSSIATTVVSTATLAAALMTSPLPSHAAGYGSLSPEQKFAAEAWRTVDSTYLDRTFNGQDWFQIRQDLVQKKY